MPVHPVPEWADPEVPEESLDPQGMSRRRLLARAGLVGAASIYLRLRGSDGRRNGPGLLGAAVDPHGPTRHDPGDGDPWPDTWCYTNPIFVDVAG